MTPNFILSFPQNRANGEVMEELTEISMHELCRACGTHEHIIIELVNEGVLEGLTENQDQGFESWRFTGVHLRQAKIATRLQRDLGVNLAGAALALQLMDEIDSLKRQFGRIHRTLP